MKPRPNLEWSNLERPNLERMNVERLNVKRLNVERPWDSPFKYCDIVIKHCYKIFSMFNPFPCSVFRCSVPFEVRSFDVGAHSTFSLSMFGPIRGSVFRCSVLIDIRSFEVRSFEVRSFEVRTRFRLNISLPSTTFLFNIADYSSCQQSWTW